MRAIRLATALLVIVTLRTFAPGEDFQKRFVDVFAAVVEQLARNQIAIRQFCWRMHTEVSVNGSIAKIGDDLCRYGPDGTIYKTPLGASAPRDWTQGLRTRRKDESKTEEIQDRINAVDLLVRDYVPPLPKRMKEAFEASNGLFVTRQGSDEIQLQFRDFLKAGDSVALSFDPQDKSVRAIDVTTYLAEQGDVVTLHVTFESLPDGTKYGASSVLEAAGRQIRIRIENIDYRRVWQ